MKKMSKSLTIATSSFELVIFFFTIISFSFFWSASNEIDYLGFNMFMKFAEEMQNIQGYNLIMLISISVMLLVSIPGIVISSIKIYKFYVLNKEAKVYYNSLLNKLNNILILILLPFVSYVFLNGVPNYSPEVESYWAYRFILFFPIVFSFITLAYTTVKEPNETIVKYIQESKNDYYNYNTERSILFEKTYSLVLYITMLLFFVTQFLDHTGKMPFLFHIILGLIILSVILSIFIILLPDKKLQKTDTFSYFRILIGIILTVLIPLVSDTFFINLKYKYLVYILNLLSILFSVYYIKNLKVRFYSSWSIALLVIIYSIIII